MNSTTHSQPAQYTLAIDGMTCGHCVRTVSATLGGVPGVTVRSVAVGGAEIHAPDGLTVVAALTALDEAGYPARIRETEPTGDSSERKACFESGGRGDPRRSCCG